MPLNDELFSELEKLNTYDVNQLLNEDSIKDVPDGTIQINSINNDQFSYKLQVNDQRFAFYHRSNGITRSEIYNNGLKKFSPIINGMLSIADLFNRAYFQDYLMTSLSLQMCKLCLSKNRDTTIFKE